MQELIDVIRSATTTDANKEQKAAGVQACRTIIAALDTEPGKPLVLPGTPAAPPLAGMSLDQVLGLVIARLSVMADARDATPADRETPTPPTPLRIPMAAGAPAVARIAKARPTGVARPVGNTRPLNGTRTNPGRPTATRPANSTRPSSVTQANPRKS